MRSGDKFGVFSGKMFWVWEGSHMVSAWMHHINCFHRKDPNWHMVDCIFLEPSDYVGILLVVMHDIRN